MSMTSYHAIHKQISRARGRAAEYRCQGQGCANQATQWAYDHKDPYEVLGTYDSTGRLTAYSLDPDHYLPLCRACHTLLDQPTPSKARRGLPSAWTPGTWNQAEWREVRVDVLERDGYTCQLAIPGMCTIHATVAHHTRDRLIYGDDPTYLVAACKRCNSSVGDPTRPPSPTPPRLRPPRTEEQRARRRVQRVASTPMMRSLTLPIIHVDVYTL